MRKIKTPDEKGRMSVGMKGMPYSVHEKEDGTILLNPVKIPDPPEFEREDMRAIYVNVGRGVDTVSIYSTWGNAALLAEGVAELAEKLNIPVVVDVAGIGSAVGDMIANKGREVIFKFV
jgi:hypothetical protein